MTSIISKKRDGEIWWHYPESNQNDMLLIRKNVYDNNGKIIKTLWSQKRYNSIETLHDKHK
jgi:hypothetical protein